VNPAHDRSALEERGFSLLEVLIAMTVMLVVLAGTLSVMSSAMASHRFVRDVLDLNGYLRAAMDLLERDLLQVGQGLPIGRRVGVPNGDGSAPIVRPGPAASGECPGARAFPVDGSLPAVSVGADAGPAVNGQCTDVITTLAADNQFGPVPIAAIAANGQSLTIHNSVNLAAPPVDGDTLRPGELLMVSKGTNSVLMQITAVAGQVVTFGTGDQDPLGLNQFDTGLVMLGTINQVKAAGPADPDNPVVVNGVQQQASSQVTRLRMLTYYIDTTTDPANPRLVRVVGGGQPNAVAFGVQALRLSYDLVNLTTNPAAVRMTATDLGGTGACDDPNTGGPEPCSENQIRKVNITLAMRAEAIGDPAAFRGRHTQNTLFSQVSLRNLAFVDRYR